MDIVRRIDALEGDGIGGGKNQRPVIRFLLVLVLITGALGTFKTFSSEVVAETEVGSKSFYVLLRETFSSSVIVTLVLLLVFSAFFSGTETAFFSIHRVRLRWLEEEGGSLGSRIAKILEHPAHVLTTLLIGNMIVNIIFAVLLGSRMERVFRVLMGSSIEAYLVSVLCCTAVLVLFGEILPKIFAVSLGERFAKYAVYPYLFFDKVLSPIRRGLESITNIVFHVTRFHQLRAAPFLTDEEIKAALSNGDVETVLEEEEREIIRGILEFRDVVLREILVPRPDVVALPESATVRDALEALRQHGYSRMPVYKDNLDSILGILVVKDLIPSFAKGELDRKVTTLMRPPYFVPETMTVQQFVEASRRHRIHMAVVVDEYGGTEGIVTLDDALEEVVGDIPDEGESDTPLVECIGENEYRVEGRLPLDKLEELINLHIEDEEHETLAGFLMDRSEKVLEPGDVIKYGGMQFVVEACEGKRALTVRVQKMAPDEQENKGN